MTRRVQLIGIGVGSPDQITYQAAAALRRSDVVFTVDKGSVKRDLNVLRRRICERHGAPGLRVVEVAEPARDREPADYVAEVAQWHLRRAEVWERALVTELAEDGCGSFLVWGDPALYDSTLRILAEVHRRGRVAFDVDVVPGITSISLLTARHRIPLNEVGDAVLITTGRRLAEDVAGHDTVVVMLDGGAAWTTLDPLGWHIWWGAYLGSEDELLRAGPLADVGAEIATAKRAARARKGWIMDVYLLRRSAGG